MGSRSIPLIAVDVSLLAGDAGGLTRYLRELLPVLVRLSAGRCRWALYGRSCHNLPPELLGSVALREDKLPSDLGRIVSLFTSMPYWAWRDMPDVFWGPAHRLPIWLPRRTKKMVTIHDLCWLLAPETMRPLTRTLDAYFMPRALQISHRVVAVSNATQEMLAVHFPASAHKVAVVYEGVRPLPAPLPIERLARWGVNRPYVLFVGTTEPRKNLSRLLRAFAQVIHKLPQAWSGTQALQLVLVGGRGWGGHPMDSEISSLGLDAHVQVLGRVTDEALSTLYQHAVCLAMPSLYEGFGLPLVEAMAHGTPVLTSNVAAMPEVVGAAGVLVDPLSVDSIASGIRKLMAHPSQVTQLKAQAAKFTWQQAAEQTLTALLD
jgi:glycosyltransferase involved in cell wall biosynthesis